MVAYELEHTDHVDDVAALTGAGFVGHVHGLLKWDLEVAEPTSRLGVLAKPARGPRSLCVVIEAYAASEAGSKPDRWRTLAVNVEADEGVIGGGASSYPPVIYHPYVPVILNGIREQ